VSTHPFSWSECAGDYQKKQPPCPQL
jgi:hypothetical protein